ncbi:hypothetical protein ZHAS_00022164 [Anopheles sinensis]|uniref:Uncharacterized protein n=1 Tax=Anopheles sinensis TaxID=74873 RepID=A0A084WUM8_ANOSI|nr:hypothetical protein ZHAS_00022164 [Anopheles sinensis]
MGNRLLARPTSPVASGKGTRASVEKCGRQFEDRFFTVHIIRAIMWWGGSRLGAIHFRLVSFKKPPAQDNQTKSSG